MSANWSKKYGRYSADADADDSEADDFIRKLRHPRVGAYLAGVVDGRVRLIDEASGDADARRKKRAEASRIVDAALNPTRVQLRAMPEVKEILKAAADHPKAPAEFKKRIKASLKELETLS